MTYFLGIDGGGSKTTCAVGDEAALLSTFTAGASNITRVGQDRARDSLHRAIRGACAAAKIDPRQVQKACVGVAGAGRETVANAVRKIIAEEIGGEIAVVGDMEIALEAAFGSEAGVIVIAGTGSIAYGRDAAGKTARAGGWGFAISDEGSAHWIGRTAISTLLRSMDEATEASRSDHSALFHELKKALQAVSFDDLVKTANSTKDFGSLFSAVLAAEQARDALAGSVLLRAGEELAELAVIVVNRLFDAKSAIAEVPVAMAGGVFRHSQSVRESFRDSLNKTDLHLRVDSKVVEPVEGALQLARKSR